MEKLRRGLYLSDRRREGEATRTAESGVTVLRRDRDRTRLYVELREGRNRQIRRLMDRIGHPVKKLRRVALGPLKLKGLSVGDWRELTPGELGQIRRASQRVERREKAVARATKRKAKKAATKKTTTKTTATRTAGASGSSAPKKTSGRKSTTLGADRRRTTRSGDARSGSTRSGTSRSGGSRSGGSRAGGTRATSSRKPSAGKGAARKTSSKKTASRTGSARGTCRKSGSGGRGSNVARSRGGR